MSFCFFYAFSNTFLFNIIYSKFYIPISQSTNSQNNIKNTSLNLLIGYNSYNNSNIYINESGLYQNFLITGTIGTGKTSSAMYPFTNQLLKYNSINSKKIGILILDVKGNYFKYVNDIAQKYNLQNDIIEISLNSNIKYNPLHKPNLTPIVLANRLKTILLLFSENNSESYWLDKAEQILA